MLKVLMISGSLPPEACGIGDYATNLTSALLKKGMNVFLEKFRFSLIKQTRYFNLIHVQYPSAGYRKSLLPQLLSLFIWPHVLTCHEFTQAHFLRKLSIIPFLLFSRNVIVTNDYEKKNLLRIFPWLGRKLEVIPVISAVEPEVEISSPLKREGLVFFGLMRPNKGLEEFLELVCLLKEKGCNMPAHIIAAIPAGGDKCYEDILKKSIGLNIIFHINEPLLKVSTELLKCKYAYQYYPDGLSERRSSFMATISHGLITFSNSGNMTSQVLKQSFIDVDSSEKACVELLRFEADADSCVKLQNKSLEIYHDHYSSNKIAGLHIDLYKKALNE